MSVLVSHSESCNGSINLKSYLFAFLDKYAIICFDGEKSKAGMSVSLIYSQYYKHDGIWNSKQAQNNNS